MVQKYRVCGLDVWGNEDDGFEVNDSHDIGFIEIENNCSDEQIIKSLVDKGFLNAAALELAEVDFVGNEAIFINEKDTGRPSLNLMVD
jgi:hypothetical protein